MNYKRPNSHASFHVAPPAAAAAVSVQETLMASGNIRHQYASNSNPEEVKESIRNSLKKKPKVSVDKVGFFERLAQPRKKVSQAPSATLTQSSKKGKECRPISNRMKPKRKLVPMAPGYNKLAPKTYRLASTNESPDHRTSSKIVEEISPNVRQP